MINVTRDPASPPSLNSAEIRQYIDDIQAHLADPENVQKPEVKPSYRTSDLLEAFDNCFHKKCYLTEQWFPNSYCMDVEHFVGQSEDPAKTYEWSNLYPADHKFNRMKPRNTPAGGYLDPCDPNDDVETEILYSLIDFGNLPGFEARNPANIKAVNTSRLLERLHNGHNENTTMATADLRMAIYKKYQYVLTLIINWLREAAGSNLKNQYGQELKLHLSRKRSFTMLLRSSVIVTQNVPAEFLD